MTEDEFTARFVVEMMRASPMYDGDDAELRAYAEDIAPTYWAEPDQREEGPEECARTDVSYWEE